LNHQERIRLDGTQITFTTAAYTRADTAATGADIVDAVGTAADTVAASECVDTADTADTQHQQTKRLQIDGLTRVWKNSTTVDLSGLTRVIDYNSKLKLRNDTDPKLGSFFLVKKLNPVFQKPSFFNSLSQHDGFIS